MYIRSGIKDDLMVITNVTPSKGNVIGNLNSVLCENKGTYFTFIRINIGLKGGKTHNIARKTFTKQSAELFDLLNR